MNKSLIWIISLVVIILAIGFFVTRTAKTPGEIKIGVILPLTGDFAEIGTKALNGIELAIDAYNDTTPNLPIKLIVEDSRANPTDGVAAIRKLINVDHIKLILGDITSGVVLAIAPIAEDNQVVVLSPGASNPKVRDSGDYIFRNWASDNFDGEVMARYLTDNLKKHNAVLIYINNEYGLGLADAFEKTFIKYGGNVALKEKYDQGATDFRTILAKMKGVEFDCVYLPGQPIENGLIIRQLKELNIITTITSNLSAETPDFYKITKGAGEGIIYSTPVFDLNTNDQNIRAFVKFYESRFKEKPDVAAGHAYDAANIMLYAIKMANYDINKVKSQLYDINNFPGVTGYTTFDDHGDVFKPVMIKKLNKDGSSTIIESYQP